MCDEKAGPTAIVHSIRPGHHLSVTHDHRGHSDGIEVPMPFACVKLTMGGDLCDVNLGDRKHRQKRTHTLMPTSQFTTYTT